MEPWVHWQMSPRPNASHQHSEASKSFTFFPFKKMETAKNLSQAEFAYGKYSLEKFSVTEYWISIWRDNNPSKISHFKWHRAFSTSWERRSNNFTLWLWVSKQHSLEHHAQNACNLKCGDVNNIFLGEALHFRSLQRPLNKTIEGPT